LKKLLGLEKACCKEDGRHLVEFQRLHKKKMKDEIEETTPAFIMGLEQRCPFYLLCWLRKAGGVSVNF